MVYKKLWHKLKPKNDWAIVYFSSAVWREKRIFERVLFAFPSDYFFAVGFFHYFWLECCALCNLFDILHLVTC